MSVVPYIFAPGTPILSSQVNANFEAVSGEGTPFAAVVWEGGTVSVNQGYLIDTSTAAQSVPLPEIAAVTPGSVVMIIDQNYNAGNNNITVQVYFGDIVWDHGVARTAYTMQISGTILLLYATALGWRDFLIGG